MTVGPVQVIIFGFDHTDQFRGEVLAELASLRGRGLIRLLDPFLALKESLSSGRAYTPYRELARRLGVGESAIKMAAHSFLINYKLFVGIIVL